MQRVNRRIRGVHMLPSLARRAARLKHDVLIRDLYGFWIGQVAALHAYKPVLASVTGAQRAGKHALHVADPRGEPGLRHVLRQLQQHGFVAHGARVFLDDLQRYAALFGVAQQSAQRDRNGLFAFARAVRGSDLKHLDQQHVAIAPFLYVSSGLKRAIKRTRPASTSEATTSSTSL